MPKATSCHTTNEASNDMTDTIKKVELDSINLVMAQFCAAELTCETMTVLTTMMTLAQITARSPRMFKHLSMLRII